MSADAIITQNTTFIRTVAITNDDGTAYNLTGAVGVYAALSAPDGYETVDDIELTVLSAAGGTAQVELSAIVTAGLPAPAWVDLEIKVIDSGNKHQPVGKYTFRVEPGSFA